MPPTPPGEPGARRVPQTGCTVKLNIALKELPSFKARPGTRMPHHLGQINTPLSKDEWQAGYEAARGRPAARAALVRALFSHRARPERGAAGRAHDERLRPVRPSYVRRAAIGTAAASDVQGPRDPARSPGTARTSPKRSSTCRYSARPTSSARSGSTGGHIFQGECLPENMWDRRFSPRTPMPGVFLCGACTYPGGSVIAINGRNAAMEILNGC